VTRVIRRSAWSTIRPGGDSDLDKDTLAFHLGGVTVAVLLADEFR